MANSPETPTKHTTAVFIARQPIFDRDLEVFAYELLFRAGQSDSAGETDPETATTQVLMNAFTEFDLADLIENHPAFIIFTRNLLISPPPFDKERFVIQIGDDITPDEELTTVVQGLRQSGFRISISNGEQGSLANPLLRYAHFVRLNALVLDEEMLGRQISRIREINPEAKVIAHKLETQDKQQACVEMGLDLFQGYFLSRPRVMTTATIPENRMVVLQLLKEVRNPNLDMRDLETSLSRDPKLVFKLLKVVNSAAYRRASAVKSIGHALSMLGMNRIRSWVSMIALCDLEDRPDALQVQAMVRARSCELIANRLQEQDTEQFFSAGLLSMLDAFFDRPLSELLEAINLSEEMQHALIDYDGPVGQVLHSVIDYERGDFESPSWFELHGRGLSVNDIAEIYVEACRWARASLKQIESDHD